MKYKRSFYKMVWVLAITIGFLVTTFVTSNVLFVIPMILTGAMFTTGLVIAVIFAQALELDKESFNEQEEREIHYEYNHLTTFLLMASIIVSLLSAILI